ncbi:hypothetical protein VNI00_006282 [Paramarasmius palmivorus]|uniref:F-box domain-containing protein n=1 Tax=Paramarasmius palmivorus TaxID=297713 RepID=A0AAW0D8F1_9AGAR
MVLFSRPGRTPIPREIGTSILQEVVDTWNPITGSKTPHPLTSFQCVSQVWQQTVLSTPALWSRIRLYTPGPSQLAFLSRQLLLSESSDLHIILQNESITSVSAAGVRSALAQLNAHKYRWKSAYIALCTSIEIAGAGDIFASPAKALTDLLLACEHNASESWTSRAVQWVGGCTSLRNIDLQLSMKDETPLSHLLIDAMPGRLSAISVLASYFALDTDFLNMLQECTNLEVLDVLSLSVDLSLLPAPTMVAQLPYLKQLYLAGEVAPRGMLLCFISIPQETVVTFGQHRVDLYTACAGLISHPCNLRVLKLVVSDRLKDAFGILLEGFKGPLRGLDELDIFLDSLQPLPPTTRREVILLPDLSDLSLRSCRSDAALHSFLLPIISAPLLQKLETGSLSPCASLVEEFIARSGCTIRTLELPVFRRETSRLGPLLALVPHLSHLHIYISDGDQLLGMLCRYKNGKSKSLQVLPLLSIVRMACSGKSKDLVKKLQKLRPSLVMDFYTERMNSPSR